MPEITLTDFAGDKLRIVEHKGHTIFRVVGKHEDEPEIEVSLTKEQVEQLVTFLTS